MENHYIGTGNDTEELPCRPRITQACEADKSCVGWTQLDSSTGHTFSNTSQLKNLTKTPACVSAVKQESHYHGGGGGAAY
jgi:hypothetical protein